MLYEISDRSSKISKYVNHLYFSSDLMAVLQSARIPIDLLNNKTLTVFQPVKCVQFY